MKGDRQSRHFVTSWSLSLVVVLTGCGLIAPSLPSPAPGADYRIYDTRAGRFVDFDVLSAELLRHDYIFFGERHDDTVAQRLQTALVERLSELGTVGTLGLEMFERDVQQALDAFAAGALPEAELLGRARAWPNYPTAYAPTVRTAVERGWQVLATNLPQPLASAVAQEGLVAIADLPGPSREWIPSSLECPRDEYFERFEATVRAHHPSLAHPAAVDPAAVERMYFAQCARDETMAESLADRARGRPALHLNGAFHSDHRLGIVPRLLRREPGASVVVISAFPVATLAAPPVTEHRARADFLIFTRSRSGS
jgi:uncharacterized iron-regulated protein